MALDFGEGHRARQCLERVGEHLDARTEHETPLERAGHRLVATVATAGDAERTLSAALNVLAPDDAAGLLLLAVSLPIARTAPPACSEPECRTITDGLHAMPWRPCYLISERTPADHRWLYVLAATVFAEASLRAPGLREHRRSPGTSGARGTEEIGQLVGGVRNLLAAREALGVFDRDHRRFAASLANQVPDHSEAIERALERRVKSISLKLKNAALGRGGLIFFHLHLVQLARRLGLQTPASAGGPSDGPEDAMRRPNPSREVASKEAGALFSYQLLEHVETAEGASAEETDMLLLGGVRHAESGGMDRQEFVRGLTTELRFIAEEEREFELARQVLLRARALGLERSGWRLLPAWITGIFTLPRALGVGAAAASLAALALLEPRDHMELIPRGGTSEVLLLVGDDRVCAEELTPTAGPGCGWWPARETLTLHYRLEPTAPGRFLWIVAIDGRGAVELLHPEPGGSARVEPTSGRTDCPATGFCWIGGGEFAKAAAGPVVVLAAFSAEDLGVSAIQGWAERGGGRLPGAQVQTFRLDVRR